MNKVRLDKIDHPQPPLSTSNQESVFQEFSFSVSFLNGLCYNVELTKKYYCRQIISFNVRQHSLFKTNANLKDNLQNFPIISFLNRVLSFWLLSVGLEVKLLFSDQSFLGTVC